MKSILAIETSSSLLSLAFWNGEGPVLEKKIPGFQNHAEKLLPETDKLLRRKKTSIRKVDTFLIGRGPGSFTGLRVGYGTLKGFLAVQKRKCFGALSLDLVAEKIALPEKAALCVAMDAHRAKVYFRIYQKKQAGWVSKKKALTLPVNDWLASLPSEVYLAGNAAARYAQEIQNTRDKKIHVLSEAQGYPLASTLIDLYRCRPKALQKLEKPKDFIPLYFRLSEAEERRNESKIQTQKKSHGVPRAPAS